MSNLHLHINRYMPSEKQTIGDMFVLDEFNHVKARFDCLELPWKDNKQNISCIPAGIYPVETYNSPKHGKVFLLKNVPGRSMIEIHAGNYYTDIEGCILPGKDLKEIDGDGFMDVVDSRPALQELFDMLPDSFELRITE